MRICFVSHEFPPDTAGGGIGTYLDQVSALLAARRHSVDVFCGANEATGTSRRPDGVAVHRLAATTPVEFRKAIGETVAKAHAQHPFDVVEATDFDAPANELKLRCPELPCVVKLHTPRFAIDELQWSPPSSLHRLRMAAGALRRGRLPAASPPIRRQPAAQEEIRGLELADEIAAPSRAVADAAAGWAAGVAAKSTVFPYPYAPTRELLSIAPGGMSNRVTFLGRLETRKGVVDLADAIPEVVRQFPAARIRFVGRSMTAPDGSEMAGFLRRRLGESAKAVEFTGPRPQAQLPGILAETDILVAPSHWESFGLVCCEALAAARAVIGSSAGGMAEILDGGRAGVLVPPRDPANLAAAIVALLRDGERRRALGEAGRARVLTHFAPDTVIVLQLESYARAVARCRGRPQ